jgi:sn-glycerol 3-phosphate transport system permease protein
MSYALVSVTLIVTSSPSARPLAVGLSLFAAPASSIDIPVTSVATVMVIVPLLIGFLIFQRQFVHPCHNRDGDRPARAGLHGSRRFRDTR